jgi:hypothetical protein
MKRSNAGGTCLQGYVKTSYNRLVEVFGEPHYESSPDDKVTVEWCFELAGRVFTIYDYKDPSAKSDAIEEFHVGGNSREAVDAVLTLLGSN